MNKNIVIIGATSAIAHHTAREWAKQGAEFFLVARDPQRLERLKEDLLVMGASRVLTRSQDLLVDSEHDSILMEAKKSFTRIDILLIAHGTLMDQKEIQEHYGKAEMEIRSNYLSPVSILTRFTPFFEQQASGQIGVISSVAGDRGRQSNYVYGSAKAGLSAYCSGLRNRLYHRGVGLTLIKPGFVATPMTQGLGLKGPLVSKPEVVGKQIARAIDRGAKTVYTPGYWRLIMLMIQHIPSVIFDRLKM